MKQQLKKVGAVPVNLIVSLVMYFLPYIIDYLKRNRRTPEEAHQAREDRREARKTRREERQAHRRLTRKHRDEDRNFPY